jgi:multicomponent Na+:H+ antiporter subunit G
MRDAVAFVLLGLGLVVVVLSCVAMAALRDPLDRLHVVTPASTLGVVGVCSAVVVYSGLDAAGTSAILLAVVVFGTSPLLTHACARSIEVRRRGSADLPDRPGSERTPQPGPAS